jgi:putative tricarboxylic transport membrane protein
VRPLARSGDFWSGIALASLGAYIVSQAWRWDYLTEDGPGAGFFPLWYGGAMIALSIALVIATAMKGGEHGSIQWREVRRAFACWAGFVASIALMPWTGFAISFALLTWFIVKVMARQSQAKALVWAVAFAAGFYLVFDVGLDLNLPRGVFL